MGAFLAFTIAFYTTEYSFREFAFLTLLCHCVPMHHWFPLGAPIAGSLVPEILEPLAVQQSAVLVPGTHYTKTVATTICRGHK